MPEGTEPLTEPVLTEGDVAMVDDVAAVGGAPVDDVAGGSSDLRPSNSAQMLSSRAYTYE